MKHSLKRGLAIMLALALVCSLTIIPVMAVFSATPTFTTTGFTVATEGAGGNIMYAVAPATTVGDATGDTLTGLVTDSSQEYTGAVELTPADYIPGEEAYFVLCVWDNDNPGATVQSFPFFYDTTAHKFVKAEQHALSVSVAAFPTNLTYTGSAQNVEVAITVKSTGLQDESNVTLALDGADAASFEITGASTITSLTAGSTDNTTAKLKFKGTNAKDSYAVTVKVTSNDVTTAVTANVTVKVAKATPNVTITAPTGAALNVVAGTHLNDVTLEGTVKGADGAALAGGTLAWKNTAANPELTSGKQGWTYTPADTNNYKTVEGEVTFTVAGAINIVITPPANNSEDGTSIVYDGQPHAADFTATQDGNNLKDDYKLVYNDGANDSETAPTNAGNYTVKVVKKADDSVAKTATFAIGKATPAITFTPTSFTKGSVSEVTASATLGATPTAVQYYYEKTPAVEAKAEVPCSSDKCGTTCPCQDGSKTKCTDADHECNYEPEVTASAAVMDWGTFDEAKAYLNGLKAEEKFKVKASYEESDNFVTPTETEAEISITAPVSGGGGGVSNNFTVTYNAGAHGALAAGAKSSEQVKRNESPKNVPAVVANAGYAFIGWTADGKTLVDPAAQTITKNTTFTAVYGDHLNYMVGRSAMEFVPNGNLTRAEAAAILSRLTEGFAEDGTYPAAPYSDLVSGAWYVKYINFAADKGIVNGRTDGTFDPDANITRAEFATMIANFAKIAPVDTAAVSTDVAGHWAEGYIAALEQAKIVTGYEDGTFKPNNSITRAEAATMVNGAIGRVPMTGLDLSVNGYDNPFVDVNESQWFYGQVMEATVDHVTAHFHK